VKIKFNASLPPIQSAISFSGDGGCRIKLDVPETDTEAMLQLAKLTCQLLQVTIEVVPQV